MAGKNACPTKTKRGQGTTLRKPRRRNTKRKQRQQKRQTQPLLFVEPQSCDVLMGRGPGFVNHPGNLRFQELTDAKYDAYNGARCKQVRASIRKGVVAAIHETGGRFLSMEEDTGRWFEVSKKVSEEKVAMSIRNTRRKTPSTRSDNGVIMTTNTGVATTLITPPTPLPVVVWLAGVPLTTPPQMQLTGAIVNGVTLHYPSWPLVGMAGPPAGGTPAPAILESRENPGSSPNIGQATHVDKNPIAEEITTGVYAV